MAVKKNGSEALRRFDTVHTGLCFQLCAFEFGHYAAVIPNRFLGVEVVNRFVVFAAWDAHSLAILLRRIELRQMQWKSGSVLKLRWCL
jgi:hypothetical protein